jgi:stearoyl-CoA 9-desaturase NADPH oxidoreductase
MMFTSAKNTAARTSRSLTRPQAFCAGAHAMLSRPWIETIVHPNAVETCLTALHPMWSLASVRAKVVAIRDETADCKTFVLQTNALWRGARAGQFVRVMLEIDGRRVERAYSLSQIDGLQTGNSSIAISVKRQGKVSGHMHHSWQVGTVVNISQAAGEFVLPTLVLPEKILLLSAGSGITPMLALLAQLQAQHYQGSVILLHICRSPEQFIFARRLQQMAQQFPVLRIETFFSAESGRWDANNLLDMVPDLAARSTWVCGPGEMMAQIEQLWHRLAIPAALHSERFTAAPVLAAQPLGTSVSVQCASSGKQFVSNGAEPLLLQAERAGLTPKHGCRIGICHSCQCIKTSGTVENLQTGEINAEPGQLIRICISAARSELVLDI